MFLCATAGELIVGQVSLYLRKIEGGYSHWCPGCMGMHVIPTDEPHPNDSRWTFNGNVSAPTFSPSVRIRRYAGDQVVEVCHYNVTAGWLHFHPDTTHALSGVAMTMSELPPELRD